MHMYIHLRLKHSLQRRELSGRASTSSHTDKHPQKHGYPSLTMVSLLSVLTRRSPIANAHTVDAIIFLAPISGFDQTLAEDRSVNRLVS